MNKLILIIVALGLIGATQTFADDREFSGDTLVYASVAELHAERGCFGYYVGRSRWPGGYDTELLDDYDGDMAVILGVLTAGIFNSIYVPYVKVRRNEANEMAWLISESYRGGGKNMDHLWNEIHAKLPEMTESQLALLIRRGNDSRALCEANLMDRPLNFNGLKKAIVGGVLSSEASTVEDGMLKTVASTSVVAPSLPASTGSSTKTVE